MPLPFIRVAKAAHDPCSADSAVVAPQERTYPTAAAGRKDFMHWLCWPVLFLQGDQASDWTATGAAAVRHAAGPGPAGPSGSSRAALRRTAVAAAPAAVDAATQVPGTERAQAHAAGQPQQQQQHCGPGLSFRHKQQQ